MVLFYLLLLTIGWTAGCPDEEVPPCKCTRIGFHSSTIDCTNVDNVDTFRTSIYNIRTSITPIRALHILNSNILYLPSGLFDGLAFERLVIDNSTIMSLSDSDTALVGLEKSLKTLIIQECTVLNGLDWYQLRNLEALRELTTLKTGMMAIDDEVKGIAGLNLTKLMLTQDQISYISENAFSTFHYLETLSLKYNLIGNMTRSMFPNPANKLAQIILSYNKISSLPSDFFTNMPSLISVVLAGNEFLTLDQALFAPIWKNLNKIDVGGNALRCDCRMKWLFAQRFPRNTWGSCGEPKQLNGKDLVNLSESDLWCY
ncbi:leucine-rich repeat and immunoglobulin-like domain-containing nogo receptor-interacting protein 3 [Parasteatoda tepidariorum]|uniref:leucine-rich repeat and immunoglobulin-like domain-containing nogo receptor-interacting protein 3 n=1 Tax=Parasteatoda tepidariorum TaxID=114398 RepID=UPI001C726148|nr:leucine-rich repeat and immunoglobulin-like domain-containing nogo receptor-interacting protein 3 [Parasteatoda tepidariorum]